MHAPRESHLEVVLHILIYLKSAPRNRLFVMRNNHLQRHTNSDYGGSVIDRRSTSGDCTFVGGNLITWRNKKQTIVARSNAKVEFRDMAQGICELLWIKINVTELKLAPSGSMRLYCDDKTAINIATQTGSAR